MIERKYRRIAVTASLLALSAAAWLLPEYYLDVLTTVMIFAILAISMELVLGTTGLVSFGQAAFFGVGAYAVVVLQKYLGVDNLLAVGAGAVVASAAVGAFVGALSLRTRHVYFIMVTLAFAQMMYHIAHDTPLVGGSDGMYLGRELDIASWAGLEFAFEGTTVLFLGALVSLVGCIVIAVVLLRAKFGRALKGIGSNERRMAAVGYLPYRYKLAVFTIGAAMAGLAGFLYCAKHGAASPEMMGWQKSGVVLLMVIIGGIGRLWGAVCGAAIYVLLQEVLSSEDVMGPLAAHWLLLFGIAIILIVACWPKGFAGLVEKWMRPKARETA
ncbi:branched-chain amino acid ABC transporter permease [Pigmentiphaga sp. H8]|uniref:branched-chain amino acid ABC transporter permease n=1 Tax=Pigmentiphaga sp. H8 TaxID=2488560 RepID=UPI0013763086|nr:branched-chain amino acid ABC transporter permease [Pigmentiphaga sp. H8]